MKGSNNPEASFSEMPPENTTRSHLCQYNIIIHTYKKNMVLLLLSVYLKNE